MEQHVQCYTQLTLHLLQFSTVSGGISNINAKLTPKQQQLGLAPVMFKVFGEKTEKIINRAAEKVVVVALGKQGFGPKVSDAAGKWEALLSITL